MPFAVYAPIFRRYLAYVRPYRYLILGATLCGLLKFNIPLIYPWVIKHFIDALGTPAGLDPATTGRWMAGVFAAYVVWAIATYYRSAWADRVSHRVSFDLRLDLHRHLLRLPLIWHEQHRIGAVTSRLMADVATAQNLAGAAMTNTVMDLSTLILISAILIAENSSLALLALISLPFYIALAHRYQKRIRGVAKVAQQRYEETTGEVAEQFATLVFDRVHNRESAVRRRFARASRRYLNEVLRNVRNNAQSLTWVGLVSLAAPAAVIWVAVLEVQAGRLSAGGLVAFYAYLGLLFQPLNRLAELNILLSNALSANERIFEIFNLPVEKPTAHLPAARIRDATIEFHDVEFRYPAAGRAVLRGVNLRLAARQTVALVGRSGAGKTTMFKLLTRLYDPDAGRILIGDLDITGVRSSSLRAQIAMVPQEPVILAGSVADNLRLARRDATHAQMVAAARAAHAHDFISALPAGYATEIGERGAQLSGGERQRLAIARALLKEASLVLLDEPTSALDPESEAAVRDGLRELTAGKTTLIIAHRLHTVMHADQLVVMEQGRVAQQGTHAQLYAEENGEYRRLFERYFSLQTMAG